MPWHLCKRRKNCTPLGILSLSSNNPQYFKTRKGYVICKNNFGNDLIPAHVSSEKIVFLKVIKFKSGIDTNLAEKCRNSTFFVPKTVEDMQKAIEKINLDQLEKPLRIWTDYEMFNRTHFSSKTGRNWWSKLDYLEYFRIKGINPREVFKQILVR